MATKPKTIDEYLATVANDQRAVLEKLRATIRKIAPAAEECISYGLPAFRWNGKPVASFAASKYHYAYYPMSGSVVTTLQHELRDYDTSKGAIRFAAEKLLPVSLLRKLIKARMAEIAERLDSAGF